MTRPTDPSRRELWVRLLLYPGHTLPTAAAPVLVGTGLAVHDGEAAAVPALLAFVGSWLIHVGGVFFDNHELLRLHPGVVEHPELTGAVQTGALRLSTLRLATAACFALALVPGLWLVGIGGPFAFLLGVLGVLASAGYAAGVPSYARWGLADPLFFLMFGVVAVAGTWFSQAASHLPEVPTLAEAWRMLPGSVFLVGLPVGALVTCVLVIDDVRDRDFDRAKRWRTGPVRFGLQWSRLEFRGLLALAYAAPVLFWLGLRFPAFVLLPLLTLPRAVAIASTVSAAARREDLVPMTPRMSQLSLAYALLLAAGLCVPPA